MQNAVAEVNAMTKQNLREKRYEQLRLKRELDRVAALDDYSVPPKWLCFLKSLSHSERKRVHLGKIAPRS